MIYNYVVSLIRSAVPLGIGVVVTWLASFGVSVDSTATAALVAGIGGVAGAAWYALARWAEHRWPKVGVLLGVPKAPSYAKKTAGSDAGSA